MIAAIYPPFGKYSGELFHYYLYQYVGMEQVVALIIIGRTPTEVAFCFNWFIQMRGTIFELLFRLA